MKRTILAILATSLASSTVQAQFNTIGDVQSVKVTKPVCQSEKEDSSIGSSPEDETIDSVSSETNNGGVDWGSKYMSVSLPLKKIQINSKFGMRMHPIYHKRIMHNGVDLHARHEDVLSMLPGRVIKVGYDDRSGKFVTVQSANYTISYCHLSQQYVRQNDFVKAGDALGLTGKTGAATGEHLHLTTKKDGKAFNPVILINVIRKIRDANLTL